MLHLNAGVQLLGEVDAGRADQLGHHDTLGAVDDEGAARGHEREVAHEDELLLHLAGLLVDELDVDEEGRLVGDVLGTALGDGGRGVTKLVVAEGDLHGVGGVLDRGELLEGLREPLAHETLERLLLNRDKVGQFHCRRNLAEAYALALLRPRLGRRCVSHQALPPS